MPVFPALVSKGRWRTKPLTTTSYRPTAALCRSPAGRKGILPELAGDPLYLTDPLRLANQQPLRVEIERWLADKTVNDAQAILDNAGVPASAVLRLDQILTSDYARERELVKQVKHPTAGNISIVPQPVKMSAMAAEPALVPPALGEHTASVLRELLAIDEATLTQLKAQGVI